MIGMMDLVSPLLFRFGYLFLAVAKVRSFRKSRLALTALLERYENVSVRYVENTRGLGAPDMIVIPGTKSTISCPVSAGRVSWLRPM